jgi:hypothetical protein
LANDQPFKAIDYYLSLTEDTQRRQIIFNRAVWFELFMQGQSPDIGNG